MSDWTRRDMLRAAGAGAAGAALSACVTPVKGEKAWEPAPAAPGGMFVDLPTGIRMYYEMHGEKGDPFLLLGGTGSDHGLWTHHLPELTKDFRVITRKSFASSGAWWAQRPWSLPVPPRRRKGSPFSPWTS